ncbi:TPA: O-antigen ligase family protein [Clostridium perfringens]
MNLRKKENKALVRLTLLTIFLTIILGNSSTFSLGNVFKGIPVKITEILMIINLFLLFINFLLNKKNIYLATEKILLIWCIFGVISIFINIFFYRYKLNEVLYGSLYGIRYFIYILYTIFVSEFLVYSNINKNDFFRFIIKSYLIVCILGIIQIIVWPNAIDYYAVLSKFNVYLLNPDPHINRVISTYLDPNYLSAILIIPINLTLILMLKEKKKLKYLIAFLVLVATLIATVSRSGLIGLVISLGITLAFTMISVNTKKEIVFHKIILLTFILLIIIVPIVIYLNLDSSRLLQRIIGFRNDPSAIARFLSWKESFNIINDNKLIGIGYNMLGFYTGNLRTMTSFGVDASLLLVAITTGVLGLTLYLSYYIKKIYVLIKYMRKDKYVFSSLIGITVASLIMSMFNNLLFYPLWIIPFFVIIKFSIRDASDN